MDAGEERFGTWYGWFPGLEEDRRWVTLHTKGGHSFKGRIGQCDKDRGVVVVSTHVEGMRSADIDIYTILVESIEAVTVHGHD